ncbi:MAG TPA: response regulator [Bryobacteraceae bacterium]|nr:response regulator [Bryobacteraceae bacterium]
MAENKKMGPQMQPELVRNVLIVEDSENSAATMEMALLGIPGLSVLRAPSGLEALRILKEPGSDVQAIITDLNMPRMDGFELIRLVREDGRMRAVPIIVVSADTDPGTPDRVAQMKVDAFFAKPFSPAQVRRKLEQLLHAKTD